MATFESILEHGAPEEDDHRYACLMTDDTGAEYTVVVNFTEELSEDDVAACACDLGTEKEAEDLSKAQALIEAAQKTDDEQAQLDKATELVQTAMDLGKIIDGKVVDVKPLVVNGGEGGLKLG